MNRGLLLEVAGGGSRTRTMLLEFCSKVIGLGEASRSNFNLREDLDAENLLLAARAA